MFGLLQIMIYLFCIYLVYKGIEIFQIAFVSEKGWKRSNGIAIGVVLTAFAVLVGIVAVYLTESMIAEATKNLPKF